MCRCAAPYEGTQRQADVISPLHLQLAGAGGYVPPHLRYSGPVPSGCQSQLVLTGGLEHLPLKDCDPHMISMCLFIALVCASHETLCRFLTVDPCRNGPPPPPPSGVQTPGSLAPC